MPDIPFNWGQIGNYYLLVLGQNIALFLQSVHIRKGSSFIDMLKSDL